MHDDFGALQRVIAEGLLEGLYDVRTECFVNHRCIVGERSFNICDHIQHVDVGPHHVGCIASLLDTLCDYDSDYVADEADPLLSEGRATSLNRSTAHCADCV